MIYQSSAQKYKWKAISILHEKAKLISAQRGPHTMQRARERTTAHRHSPREASLQREAARGEEAYARWRSCKNALALSNNSANTTRTISTDNDFAMKPLELSPLYNGKVLGHPRSCQCGEQWH